MYDDEEDDDESSEESDLVISQKEEAAATRGKADRSFFDNLAKDEDARHNAMRADLAKRSLAVGERRQKLKHKESVLHSLESKIIDEQDRIEYETKKAYRESGVLGDDEAANNLSTEPTLSNSSIGDEERGSTEFSIERATSHIKQLQSERDELDMELRDLLADLHEEERALSQLQHQLMRF